MKTVVLTCRTLEDEVNAALAKSGREYEIVWLESGLHNVPKKLTKRIQEELDGIEADRVLLAMGFCGNSLAGIRANSFQLIVPRVDDCISLLLGSVERRLAVSREHAAYFLTEGWLRGENNICAEYLQLSRRYDEETLECLMEMLCGHYRTLGLLDCGVKPIEELEAETRVIADTLRWQQRRIPATLDYLSALLTGPWPREDFLLFSPGSVITAEDLYLPLGSSPLQS